MQPQLHHMEGIQDKFPQYIAKPPIPKNFVSALPSQLRPLHAELSFQPAKNWI
jgi:hypothetical protein